MIKKMISVQLIYKEYSFKHDFNNDVIMKDIFQFFSKVMNRGVEHYYFQYNDSKNNKLITLYRNYSLNDYIKNDKMEILVYDKIKTNYLLKCPICEELYRIISIKNYKLTLECKNKHRENDLKLEDIPKLKKKRIICNRCYKEGNDEYLFFFVNLAI
jgi:DNA-directed RNA polymerase subunit M/transcription elongation factor TFIIS